MHTETTISSTNTTNRLPRHVAIIMDGNGRWAQKQLMPRIAGHKAGVDVVRRTIQACGEKEIKILTLFAFSSENWRRPAQEVSFLMNLFLNALDNEVNRLHENNVQLRVIGDSSRFSQDLQNRIVQAEQLTAANTGLKLVIAAGYGGRWDITEAARKIAEQIAAGQMQPSAITPELFASYLSCQDLPEPDLLIRTGGEFRISNFLIWQLAYTELFFTNKLWPEFDGQLLDEALVFYSNRQRRFGYTGEQVEQIKVSSA